MDYLFKDDNFMDASGIDEHKKLFGDCSVDDVDKQSMRLLVSVATTYFKIAIVKNITNTTTIEPNYALPHA